MNEREGEVRKDAGMWGDGEGDGERPRWKGKNLSIYIDANGNEADRVRKWNNESCKVLPPLLKVPF